MHLGNQPRPEVGRLGVRVVHAEGGHASIDPHHDHAIDLLIDLLRGVIEVNGVDVLVLLGRVLGVGDGAIGKHCEKLWVRFRPRVIR